VLLSLIGPQPFSNTQDAKNISEQNGVNKSPVELKPLTNGTTNGHASTDPPCHNDEEEEEALATDRLNSVTVQI
jgi:hypothetical protein